MSTTERRRSPVYRQLKAYQQSWKWDHDAALACRDWEDVIAVGINIFHMLREREQAWRDQVFSGTLAVTQEDDLDHQARYTNWLATTTEFFRENLPALEKQFGTVQGVSELRTCAESAESILREWQTPRMSSAVGLREMALNPKSALELDQVVQEATRLPADSRPAPMAGMSAFELKRRSRN